MKARPSSSRSSCDIDGFPGEILIFLFPNKTVFPSYRYRHGENIRNAVENVENGEKYQIEERWTEIMPSAEEKYKKKKVLEEGKRRSCRTKKDNQIVAHCVPSRMIGTQVGVIRINFIRVFVHSQIEMVLRKGSGSVGVKKAFISTNEERSAK